jgi:hypothetical protein
MRTVITITLSLVISALLTVGCVTNAKTVRTEESVYGAGPPATVERETTVTTTEESPEQSGGVLSGTVNVIGEVIALPFRAVGGLVSAIF